MFKIYKTDNDANISISERREGEIVFIDVDYETAELKTPKQFSVFWDFFAPDSFSLFSPALRDFRGKGMDWNLKKTESRLASWMPLHCIVSNTDRNLLNITVSDAQNPITIASGVNEQRGVYRCWVHFFTIPTTPINKYHATIRLDYRNTPYYDSVYSSVEYWENDCGYAPARVPELAKMPMDSLWYSFHQRLKDDEILKECELSKKLGMETVIIDDGWQTADNSGGYAHCGDWKLYEGKIKDMKQLVTDIHNIGMKVMLWFSIPYIGFYSENYEKYKDMLLKYSDKTKYGVFDPRYKEVRDFLKETYVNAVRDWDLDGLKLDFIDAFALTEESAVFNEKRDFESLEDAIDCLLKDVTTALYELKPDILIEFRQSYVGPSIRKYANMLRVNDCPYDEIRNRSDVINLRLTSGKTAVHSDMLMWHNDASSEEVAMQLASVIYSVPQISVRLDEIPQEHIKVLKHYLDFCRKYSDILLNGYLTAKNPESYYSQACVSKDVTDIISVYTNPVVSCKNNTNIIVNASGDNELLIRNSKNAKFEIIDCMGEKIQSGIIESETFSALVPTGGMINVIKAQGFDI